MLYTTKLFRLSACINAAHDGRITKKIDTGNFHENMSRKSNFGNDRAKIMRTLHEVQIAFFFSIIDKHQHMQFFIQQYISLEC